MITTELKKQFDSLNEYDQWLWLIKCDFRDKIKVMLDNDSTYIEAENSEEYLRMKADIGDRKGVHLLFKALGIYCESV